jgi:membrane associated rhomboid family serine protease
VFFLGLWFLLQILGGFAAPGASASLTIWALLGGLAAGLTTARLFQRQDRGRIEWWGA